MKLDEQSAEEYWRMATAITESLSWFEGNSEEAMSDAFEGVEVEIDNELLRVNLAVLRADIDAFEEFMTGHGYA